VLSEISNRHRGDLGGRLTDQRVPARVVLAASSEVAETAAGQHLIWMLLNLLARQTVEIREIQLDIPCGIKLAASTSPLVTGASDFLAAMRLGVKQINLAVLAAPVPAASNSAVFIRVGPGPMRAADFSIATTSNGWSGYVGIDSPAVLATSQNPIGPYVAACLCAGEVFKFVRGLRPDAGEFARNLWLDAASLKISSDMPKSVDFPSEISLPATILVGVGAVANAFLHVLYATGVIAGEITAIDNDPEGITQTNLNRYVLFGLPHISLPKATTAAELFKGTQLRLTPIDDSWQDWMSWRNGELAGEIVVSAVDKNPARHAIQDALPLLILGASTNEMRAQLSLYDVIGGSACLKCRNPIEPQLSDEAIIEKLRALNQDELANRARDVSIDYESLRRFLDDPLVNCGKIGGASLRKFANGNELAEWSVGFVSAMAGVLLAAEYLKVITGNPAPVLSPQLNAFRFQFWRPENASTNTRFGIPINPRCFCQNEVFRTCVESSRNSARLVDAQRRNNI
jgi:molybdopterin/thiamine biosynthesis adenylyltransferase